MSECCRWAIAAECWRRKPGPPASSSFPVSFATGAAIEELPGYIARSKLRADHPAVGRRPSRLRGASDVHTVSAGQDAFEDKRAVGVQG